MNAHAQRESVSTAAETSYPLHRIRVVLLEGVHARAVDLLGAEGYSVEAVPAAATDDDLLTLAADAHLVGIRSKTRLDERFFDAARRLWAVGCFCIGTNQVDLPAAAARGVAVFNAPFSNTRSVAEKTIADVIVLHRRLGDRSMALHQGRWVKSAAGAHEIRGRTLGIVGYGRIGSQVSVLAEAMGMRVLYHDVRDCLPLGNARAAASLDELLAEADCVTLHVPAEATTERLVGAAEIERMREGAFLVNNARGSIVDVDALAEALRSGRLGGAAIDVFPEEPAQREATFSTPLAGLPNVVLSPHIGGSTVEAQESIAVEVATKLVKLMNNGSTTTAVNVPEVELPTLHVDHHRILHFHRNEPGVLGALHSLVAESGANIAASYLQSDARHGYAILDITPGHDDALRDRLAQVPGTIRVRVLW